MAYLYRHIRLDNNETFYIGISLSDINNYKRAYTKNSRSKSWKSIVSVTDYKVEIMFDSISDEDAKQKEIEYIELYKDTVVNKHKGGFARYIDEETKNKISRKSINKKMSIEARQKMSESKTGRKLNDDTKSKMSKSHLGISPSKLNRKITSDRQSKIVLDTSTGIFYDRITDAANAFNLKRPWLSMMLNGKYKNTTTLILV
jgi:hypothetical protein